MVGGADTFPHTRQSVRARAFPVIPLSFSLAGLDPETHEPFLSAFDYIGAACYAKDFVCNGTSAEQLVGVCEALWKPDMVTNSPSSGRSVRGLEGRIRSISWGRPLVLGVYVSVCSRSYTET